VLNPAAEEAAQRLTRAPFGRRSFVVESGPLERQGTGLAVFVVAFLFAAAVSTSVVSERLAHGHSSTGWLCGLAVTFAAGFLVFYSLRSGKLPAVLVGIHLLGIACAMAFVHLAARFLLEDSGLVEQPIQLVNDGVLTLALLCLVWSYIARAPLARALLPLPSFALVLGYAATMADWHVDRFSGFGVQSYVIAQVFATAAGLFLYYILGRNAWGRA
jgi:hypothetical protein